MSSPCSSQQQRQVYRNNSRHVQIHVWVFILLIGTLLGWGWHYLIQPSRFPIHHVSILQPTQHIDTPQLIQFIKLRLHGGFFSLDTQQLSHILLTDQPWISNVTLRRQWPDRLIVAIQEKSPAARWKSTGVISQQGELFYPEPKSIPVDLPVLTGADELTSTIFSDFKQLDKTLSPLGLHITSLQATNTLNYRLTLRNHIVVIIGHDNLLPRFRQFVSLYPSLLETRAEDVAYVDLRYSNGLAVRWKNTSVVPFHKT